ncbi:enoyl-CoA hydratase/isomerase family protein [uncultured Desulfobacter sp.]|uniref:enoyl-CoA hydratase/isomerase family protein n=1 Tax=uncultured Desulfobacter sp. TaxID=240139 RepID=UPI002AAC073E|nr:enoyl-CoA hydratase/isomerase family protein [uncultured Desulfobacter sp.]
MESKRIITGRVNQMFTITLNRPDVINSLDAEMIRSMQTALNEAESSPLVRLVVIQGNGDKGFCAGGDVKAVYDAVKHGVPDKDMEFFQEEYMLDLRIFRFAKPIVVLAHGITMGGGMGLAAGADMVVATENTLMAMPETRIGFFPDVGATGWMFRKCPAGYPEFLGLTGHRIKGLQCLRLGLASHLVADDMRSDFINDLELLSEKLPRDRSKAAQVLFSAFTSLRNNKYTPDLEMDDWVRRCFSKKSSVNEILSLLSGSRQYKDWSAQALTTLGKNSPTSLVLTFSLLCRNEKKTMEEVFARELNAARFMIHHPDFSEGIRAQLVDKDKNPAWQPDTIEDTCLPGALLDIDPAKIKMRA